VRSGADGKKYQHDQKHIDQWDQIELRLLIQRTAKPH